MQDGKKSREVSDTDLQSGAISSIQMAARQDYEGFYEKEMNYRDLMGYPLRHN